METNRTQRLRLIDVYINFRRVPFGVRNGVAAFQKIMNDFIENEALSDTFAYLDDVTICGRDQAHHDENLKRFLEAAKYKNAPFQQEHSVFLEVW